MRIETNGSRRHFLGLHLTRKQDFAIGGAILAAYFIGYPIWHENTQGPRHQREARLRLERAGYSHASLRREMFKGGCRNRTSKRYSWRTDNAEGYVCSYDLRGAGEGVHVTKLFSPPPSSRS